jgi:hypothetical protein
MLYCGSFGEMAAPGAAYRRAQPVTFVKRGKMKFTQADFRLSRRSRLALTVMFLFVAVVLAAGASQRTTRPAQAAAAAGLAFSTYLGGVFDEFPYGVELTPSGAIYMTDLTEASDFPVTANASQPNNQLGDDGFLVKIDSGVAPPPPPYGDYNAFVPSVLR